MPEIPVNPGALLDQTPQKERQLNPKAPLLRTSQVQLNQEAIIGKIRNNRPPLELPQHANQQILPKSFLRKASKAPPTQARQFSHHRILHPSDPLIS